VVTVVIPTHNRSRFLREAVASVLAQRGVPLEVLVVDDGSKDETPEVLETFGDFITAVFQPHRGVSAARNHGIRLARGEWIAFLDSDDLWLPGKLEIQMAFLEAHPLLRICQTEEIWIRNGKRLNPRKYHQKPQGHCFPLLLERCLISPSAVVIHRDLFSQVGSFDESLPACEDYDLWLRIGCRQPVGLVEEPLIVKRGGHADQLSATIPALDVYRIQSLVHLLQRESLAPEQRKQAFAVLERKCLIYGAGCRKRGKWEEAERILGLPRTVASGEAV
jgi:glycosyltransferase involved in cell wall biosynthesis